MSGDGMPAVIVRRRLGSRSAKVNYHVSRWYWRNRARLAVTAAFSVACVLGAAASIGAHSLGLEHGRGQAEFAAR